MNTFYEMLSTLLTVGGVGIINYIIAEQLDAIDTTQQGTNREKALAIVFTMLDFILYLGLRSWLSKCLKGNILTFTTAAVTVFISLLISFFVSKLINELFYWLINKIREMYHLSYRKSATTWQDTFKPIADHQQRVFLYDFNHQPLGFGNRIGISNDASSNYSVVIQPDMDDVDYEQLPYDEMVEMVQSTEFRKQYDVREYVNFQQKFIAFVANAK